MDPRLKKALAIAAKAHRGQVRRGSTTPYIVHPFEVMMLLQYCGESVDVLCAAVLHDVLEDTNYPESLMQKEMGELVTNAVSVVTHDRTIKNKRARYEDYLRRLDEAESLIALGVAAADKCANLHDTILQGQKLTEHEAWWYPAVLEVLKKHIPEYPLTRELETLIEEVMA